MKLKEVHMDANDSSIRPRENPYADGHLPVSGALGASYHTHHDLYDLDADDQIDYIFE